MSTAVRPGTRPVANGGRIGGSQPADVFVVFGITGDLARVMTFQALYRLERRGLLDCPILGVAGDDWTIDRLREHARKCIADTGEAIDDDIFDRFAARLSYVSGDFGDDSTYEQVARRLGDARSPVFYLEIPPSLFGMVIEGLARVGVTGSARGVVEKPFGHDAASARALNEEVHQPPRLGFLPEGTRRPEPDQLVVRLYPTTGIRLLVEAQRSDVEQPEQASLDLEFAKQGGEGALPYEVLLHAAMIGDSRRFKHQDSIEETWRIMQPLLEAPPPVEPYEKGSWGPSAADGIVAGRGRWHEPWLSA